MKIHVTFEAEGVADVRRLLALLEKGMPVDPAAPVTPAEQAVAPETPSKKRGSKTPEAETSAPAIAVSDTAIASAPAGNGAAAVPDTRSDFKRATDVLMRIYSTPGGDAAIKKLQTEYGVKKFSQLDAGKHSELLTKALALAAELKVEIA